MARRDVPREWGSLVRRVNSYVSFAQARACAERLLDENVEWADPATWSAEDLTLAEVAQRARPCPTGGAMLLRIFTDFATSFRVGYEQGVRRVREKRYAKALGAVREAATMARNERRRAPFKRGDRFRGGFRTPRPWTVGQLYVNTEQVGRAHVYPLHEHHVTNGHKCWCGEKAICSECFAAGPCIHGSPRIEIVVHKGAN